MKLKKRKLKFAAIFGISWFTLLVLLVDGILKFQTLVNYFGSYAFGDHSATIGHSANSGCIHLHERITNR